LKALVACYSFTGNTLKVAHELQEQLGADFTRIEPVKDKWYLFKAIDAFREKKWPIKPCISDITDYDLLVVCSPVWSGRTPPGVNQYMDELQNVEGKKFAVLVTMGGNPGQLAPTQIKNSLTDKEMEFVTEIGIKQESVQSGEYVAMLDDFINELI